MLYYYDRNFPEHNSTHSHFEYYLENLSKISKTQRTLIDIRFVDDEWMKVKFELDPPFASPPPSLLSTLLFHHQINTKVSIA
jgi:hypothetical protein